MILACNEEEKTNQENNVPECISDKQCPTDKPICKDEKCIERLVCEDKTKISCNEQCIDPLIDNDNCGKCGTQCHKDETCLNGRCTVSCQYYDLARCDNSDECVKGSRS